MNDAKAANGAHAHIFLGASHESHEKRTRWVVLLTALMMVAEIIAGLTFRSMALLADGLHMATHAGALAVAAAAYAYARKRANDPRFSFGTGKVGDLTGFASALTLAIIALTIGFESVLRLLQPAHVVFKEAIVVAVIGLIVNLASAALLQADHGHDHHHGQSGHAHGPDRHHHHHQDNNLRSAYFHVLADALTSLLAIVALVAGMLLGWVWLDPLMGIVGAIVIARWSVGLLRDTSRVLLDRVPSDHLARDIRTAIESDGDSRIVDLHLWQLGPGHLGAIVALEADEPGTPEAYRDRLSFIPQLAHVTVEPNRRLRPEIPR